MQAQEIGRQLFRSASSTGANIAEGHGRYEGVEYVRFLVIAQASANETDHWLHTALDVDLGLQEDIQKTIELNTEVRKMLSATIKTLRSKISSRTTREILGEYAHEVYQDE